MSLSRLAPSTSRIGSILSLRSSHHAAVAAPAAVKPEDIDNPNFFQKVALRFKGIPLKGEAHAPKCMFDDVDKEWHAPAALPAMPKEFKEHADRDLVNFPYPERPMYPPQTRLFMMPNAWFTPFQKVTGTSGPYLFFGGLATFFVNKELWVFEEQGHMLCGWILFYLILSRSIGYKTDNWLYSEYQNRMAYFKGLIQEDLKEAVEFRKSSAVEAQSLNEIKAAFPVAIQLEATYRKNVQQVSQEIKRRVDFLVETEAAKERFEKDFLLKYITDGVVSQIESNQGGIRDAYLEDCIKELKSLAAKA
uniref:ATP synthase subunit b n=1 Tax=Rhabditophanes sp. KR3021 TaxID=114890 RepID=A0AC35TUS7_9BILA